MNADFGWELPPGVTTEMTDTNGSGHPRCFRCHRILADGECPRCDRDPDLGREELEERRQNT